MAAVLREERPGGKATHQYQHLVIVKKERVFRIELIGQKKRHYSLGLQEAPTRAGEPDSARPAATEWGNRDTFEGQNVKSFPPVTSAEKRGLALAVIHQHWQSERERGEGRRRGRPEGKRGMGAEQRLEYSFILINEMSLLVTGSMYRLPGLLQVGMILTSKSYDQAVQLLSFVLQ